jgi:hypothetical protein
MDAVDHGIDGQYFEAIALGLDYRGVVADADSEPRGSRGEPPLDARDQFALGEFRDGHFA